MRRISDTDLAVAPIGIDGGVFGWVSGSRETAAMLDAFHAVGGSLVFTADHYAGGRSEVMIGSWLKTLPDRSAAVIATTIGRHPDARGLHQRTVVRATEASLRRLDTDHIDVLVLDGEDPTVPIDDTLEALDQLQRAGKIRHVAALGHTGARLRAFQARSDEARYPRVRVALQEYSLMTRKVFEHEVSPVIAETGAGFFARRPLAHGFLTGAFRDRNAKVDGPIWHRALDHIDRRGLRVLDRLAAVAAEHEVSLARVAAAWVISKPGVTAALVAAQSIPELLDVFEARSLALTRQQVAMLDDISA